MLNGLACQPKFVRIEFFRSGAGGADFSRGASAVTQVQLQRRDL
jgi:hypothetical protein